MALNSSYAGEKNRDRETKNVLQGLPAVSKIESGEPHYAVYI